MTTSKKKASAYAAYAKEKSENIRAVISEHKTRRGLTNDDLAKLTGLSTSAFTFRKGHPGRFRLEDIWLICEALDVPEEQRKTLI